MAFYAELEEVGADRQNAIAIYNDIRAAQGDRASADSFTAHVFACVLTLGVVEAKSSGDSVAASIGLGREALSRLIAAWAPVASRHIELGKEPERVEFDEEELQLYALFERYRRDDSEETAWLAAMLTRRSMSPSHLWQDLGLASRDELGRLMRERFPDLAARNVQNMKWKKFFYRSLCELEGFTLCVAPTCRECSDFEDCFGEETGKGFLGSAEAYPVAPQHRRLKATAT